MNFIHIVVSLTLASLLPLRAAEEPPKKSFFLPKSATAAAYVLGRLSNKELIEAPRSDIRRKPLGATLFGLGRLHRLD